ncbi:hypothetical protein R6Q57_010869 [Mikania cordata]
MQNLSSLIGKLMMFIANYMCVTRVYVRSQVPKVPKFGDWENQNDVPYTVYFEKAKKGRKSKMNPQISDPSSNSEPSVQGPEEAQIRYGESTKSEPDKSEVHDSSGTKDETRVRGEEVYLTKSEPDKPKVKDSSGTNYETRVSREEVDLRKSSDSSSQPRRNSRQSGGSVQSFDNSPVHPRHHARAGNMGSVSSESNYGAGSSTPGRTRLGQVTRGDENADDGPAIPKFGGWDDNDPTSGEGYTEVFNKVRQDKHAGGGRSPIITTDNANFYGQRNEKSKGFCCFPWSLPSIKK